MVLTTPPNLKPGGESRTVAKGDLIIVPENTAHWFSKIDGVLVLMTLHVPRPLAH